MRYLAGDTRRSHPVSCCFVVPEQDGSQRFGSPPATRDNTPTRSFRTSTSPRTEPFRTSRILGAEGGAQATVADRRYSSFRAAAWGRVRWTRRRAAASATRTACARTERFDDPVCRANCFVGNGVRLFADAASAGSPSDGLRAPSRAGCLGHAHSTLPGSCPESACQAAGFADQSFREKPLSHRVSSPGDSFAGIL